MRLYKVLRYMFILLGVGLAYMLFVRYTGWGIPCVFYLATGIHCPGCGISRMFIALAQGDIVRAAQYNLLVLCLLPFALVLAIVKIRQYVRTGETPMYNTERVFYIVAFVLCVMFCILRNTNTIPFLQLP